jgi:replicative DNA helicase
MTTTDIPNANREFEQATLGACMLIGESRIAAGLLARGLRPEHFYWQPHQDVFAAIASLADRGSGIDSMTVAAELDRLGLRKNVSRGSLDEFLAHVPASGNYGEYADRVIELARWRDRQTAIHAMQTAVRARDAERWAQARAELDSATAGTRTESYSAEKWASLMFDHFTSDSADERAIPLPFRRLTEALGGGLMPGEVMALSGPTSHGKSVVADQILDHAADLGKSCHLYMTEMTAVTRGMRYLSRRTGIPFMKLRRNRLTDEDRRQLIGEMQRFKYGCSVAADWSVDDIVRDALRARYDLVVVDLLHGFHYEDERGLDRLSKAMQRLARVSTTLDGHPGTAVIAVTHLKEEGAKSGEVPRPSITSIKGGSSIKQDADFVMFVWQKQSEGATTGEGDIWIAKGRSGEVEHQPVMLQSNRFAFAELATDGDMQLAATVTTPF